MLDILIIIFAIIIITTIVTGVWIRKLGSIRVTTAWLLLMILLIGAGSGLIWNETTRLQRALERQQWPSTTGVVITSEVVGGRGAHPQVVYEYEVAGEVYSQESDLHMPNFGGSNNKRETAERLVAQYPVGTEVTVYYDPTLPGIGYLVISPAWDIFVKLSFGVVILVLGCFFLIHWIATRREKSSADTNVLSN